jgi:hypothetical protein
MNFEIENGTVQPGRQDLLALTPFVALPLAAIVWSRGSMTAIGCAAAVGGVLAAMGMLRPRWLRPLLTMSNAVTKLVVIIVHEAVLLFAYYLVFVPVGLAFRLIGRDVLHLKIDRSATTYWHEKKRPGGASSYFRRW